MYKQASRYCQRNIQEAKHAIGGVPQKLNPYLEGSISPTGAKTSVPRSPFRSLRKYWNRYLKEIALAGLRRDENLLKLANRAIRSMDVTLLNSAIKEVRSSTNSVKQLRTGNSGPQRAEDSRSDATEIVDRLECELLVAGLGTLHEGTANVVIRGLCQMQLDPLLTGNWTRHDLGMKLPLVRPPVEAMDKTLAILTGAGILKGLDTVRFGFERPKTWARIRTVALGPQIKVAPPTP